MLFSTGWYLRATSTAHVQGGGTFHLGWLLSDGGSGEALTPQNPPWEARQMIHIRCSRHSMMPPRCPPSSSVRRPGAGRVRQPTPTTHPHQASRRTDKFCPPSTCHLPPRCPPVRPASFDLGYISRCIRRHSRDAQAWQSSHRSGGHQPWHLDAGPDGPLVHPGINSGSPRSTGS